jgi:hypothetical protein
MSSFQAPDSNVWYQITDLAASLNSSLQYNGYLIYLASSNSPANPFWQIFPSDNGTYQIRNRASAEQLTGCYSAAEPAAGKSQPV